MGFYCAVIKSFPPNQYWLIWSTIFVPNLPCSSCQWPSTCLLKMNVHDDTIPVSIQMMSCKVLLNLVESIRVKSEQDTGARELLDGGVHTQVQSHSAVPDPRTVQTLSAITQ
eukprot:Em1102g1a